MAQGNSAAILANFEFNPSDYIVKPLIFDLKKSSKEKIMDKLIESFPGTNNVEHREGKNSFRIRKDGKRTFSGTYFECRQKIS